MTEITFAFIDEKDAVMERLGGNEQLLEKLLLKFYSSYRNTRENLLALLSRKDFEESYRIVHSVKGVSANLGIGKLYRSAIVLESRMKAGEYDAVMPEVLAFLSELDTVIVAMQKMAEPPAG